MKFFIFITIAITLFSCKPKGTETGNPLDDNNMGQEAPDCGGLIKCIPAGYPLSFVQNIASGIFSCQPEGSNNFDGYDEIVKLVLEQPGLNLELPIPQTTFEILQADFNDKKLTISKKAYYACSQAMSSQKFSCDSAEFKEIYDIDHPKDLSKIHRIFRADPACQEIYKMKE